MTQPPSPPAAFDGLKSQIEALSAASSVGIRAGHLNIAQDIWLSCDPQGQAEMALSPDSQGIRLSWKAADSGRWAALGMGVPIDVLTRGRYLGVRLEVQVEAPISLLPSLRYHFRDGGGMQDVATPAPVLLPSGKRVHLAHIPIERALVERAHGAEVNFFLHTDHGALLMHSLDILLMQ